MLKEFWSFIKEMVGQILSSRLFALGIVFVSLFLVLLGNLFRLQLFEGQKYLESYESQILHRETTLGTRGNIYDRDGKLLAYNQLQYNITIADVDAYDSSPSGINERNRMLLRLARIIEKYGYSIDSQYKIMRDEDGEFHYTSSGEGEKRRFIANAHGRSEDRMSEEELGKSAKELFEFSKRRYRFDDIRDSEGNAIVLTDTTALNMLHIIYTLRLTAYQRYQTTTIVRNVSEECMAEILESKGDLPGVGIEDVSVRRYNYAPYLSHILGYTGQIQRGQLEELRKTDPGYELNDIVGVWGLEKSEEAVLKGKKGEREMYLNSVGAVLEELSSSESKSGNDIYTTISATDQIAIYHLIEQEFAGILVSKLTEREDISNANVKQSQIMIPIRDAYYQLINNNVLKREHFLSEEAGAAERKIQEIFSSYRSSALAEIERQLDSDSSGTLSELPQDMQAYIVHIYDYLTSKGSGIIDSSNQSFRQSSAYQGWRDDSISMHDFIVKGIEEGWMDTSRLGLSEEYTDTGSIFRLSVDRILSHLSEDKSFDKLLYKYSIQDKSISGSLLIQALYEQGVLAMDSEAYNRLSQGDSHYAFLHFVDKVRKLQLTPAQLALDPCNGSVVVTDVHTGKVLALVTYPGFDNNRISDAETLRSYNEDLSLPLLNTATQTQLAPGSSFKPITTVAALEEGAVTMDTVIDCTGRYEEVVPNIRCWIYPSAHGAENIVDGLKNSCNYFYAELGHRLSMNGSDEYNQELGLEKIRKYASLFGLSEKSGVELDEAEPRISDIDPERSAMGQGNHAYNSVQLSRYITAMASPEGSMFKLSIVDRVTSPEGELIETVEPEIESKLSLSPVSWSAVRTGMRKIVTEGVAKNVFRGQDISIAGKTGTAQEREDRGNHALFVSYAPYDNPEISVTVTIRYGYSSGNAATLANHVYDYCFGKTSLDTILKQDASYIKAVNVSD